MVSEDVMDTVSSEPLTTKVLEYRLFGIDHAGRR